MWKSETKLIKLLYIRRKMQGVCSVAVCHWVDCAEEQFKIPEDMNLQYHTCENINSHIYCIMLY
jgi:hypothetical protein